MIGTDFETRWERLNSSICTNVYFENRLSVCFFFLWLYSCERNQRAVNGLHGPQQPENQSDATFPLSDWFFVQTKRTFGRFCKIISVFQILDSGESWQQRPCGFSDLRASDTFGHVQP